MSILETTANLATVPLNLVGGLFGNPFDPKGGHQAINTQSQKDYLGNLVNQQGGTSGVLSYDDYGTKFNLSDLKDPTSWSTAMTMGGTGWNKADTGDITYTGGKYDFDGAVPWIDKGGLMGISHNLGSKFYNYINKYRQQAETRKKNYEKYWQEVEAKKAAEAAAAAKAKADAAHRARQQSTPGYGSAPGGGGFDAGTGRTTTSGYSGKTGRKEMMADGGLINFYRYGGFI